MFKSMGKRANVWFFLAVALTVFPLETSRAQERKLEPVIMSYSAHVPARVHLWMARDLGIFAKHGLDLKLVYIAGGPTAVQALISGDVQVAQAGGQAVISAAARGAPLQIFGLSNYTLYVLVGGPTAPTIEALRGKTVATSRVGAAADFALRLVLKKIGLEPNKDVTVRPTGISVSRDRITLLTQGHYDATISSIDEVIDAQKRGHKLQILADSIDLGIVSTEDFTAAKDFLTNRRTAAAAVLRATSEAVALAKRDKDLTFKFFNKYLGQREPWQMETLYQHSVLRSLPERSGPSPVAVEQYMEMLLPTTPTLKGKQAADFINMGPARLAEK
jgi:NitT/TauT family transport system substrate-binding protein